MFTSTCRTIFIRFFNNRMGGRRGNLLAETTEKLLSRYLTRLKPLRYGSWLIRQILAHQPFCSMWQRRLDGPREPPRNFLGKGGGLTDQHKAALANVAVLILHYEQLFCESDYRTLCAIA